MDAYDLSDAIKHLWVLHTDKASGMLPKPNDKMKVMVGERQVVGVHFNRETNNIELVLEGE